MSKPSSTKESKEVWRLRLLSCFSKMWRKEAKYKAERMGDRAKPWPTPMLTSTKWGEIIPNIFHFPINKITGEKLDDARV